MNLYGNISNNLQQDLTEMARIGYTDDGFEVYVNTDDGNTPHFHYRIKGSWEFHNRDIPMPDYTQLKEGVL